MKFLTVIFFVFFTVISVNADVVVQNNIPADQTSNYTIDASCNDANYSTLGRKEELSCDDTAYFRVNGTTYGPYRLSDCTNSPNRYLMIDYSSVTLNWTLDDECTG